jgi:hypothetical protein
MVVTAPDRPLGRDPAGDGHLSTCQAGGRPRMGMGMSHKTLWRAGRIECLLCTSGASGRQTYKGHFGWVNCGGSRRRSCMGAMKQRASRSMSGMSASPLSGGDWSKWYPAVCEFLSLSVWPDGTSRVTGTVMLLTEDGRWKAWVHDRDAGEGLFVSGATPDAVLQSLETVLATGEGEWRPDRKAGKR